jgi:hypothetical protein
MKRMRSLLLAAASLLAGASLASPRAQAQQQVWLGARDPVTATMNHKPPIPDYFDLFRANAPWQDAARHTNVFFTSTQFMDHANDAELGAVIRGLKIRHIALGMEALALVPSDRCGRGIESYGRANVMDHVAQRITQLGGRLDYVAFDEPVAFGHRATGPRTCQDSVASLAQQMIEPARALKRAFPNVIFVDAEPLNNGTDEQFLTDILEFASDFRSATGFKMDAVHADPIYSDNWVPQYRQWQSRVRAAGMRFGVICRGSIARDRTSEAWNEEAVQRVAEVQRAGRVPPDDIVVQTWELLPTRMLPETDPGAMTSIIARAFGR